jgi:hypothetical protein
MNLSVDATIIESGADNLNMHPIEFLNSLDMAGLPPSKLHLKVGCPIMLLRKLAPKVKSKIV